MSKIVKPDLTYQWASAAGGGSVAYLFHQTSVVANTDTHIAAVKGGEVLYGCMLMALSPARLSI